MLIACNRIVTICCCLRDAFHKMCTICVEKSGPAPGQYDVKEMEKGVGTVKFQYCSERFKSSESLKSDGTSDSKDFAVPRAVPSSSSKRKLNFGEKAKSVSFESKDNLFYVNQ